jgi:uncharacterized delta-60 repeat protein
MALGLILPLPRSADAQVEQAWVNLFHGVPGNDDVATTLALDDDGNIYVSGFSARTYSYYDYATVKYSPTGERLWLAWYAGPEQAYDRAQAIAVDSEANVYVTGWSQSANTKFATVMYDSDGSEQWVAIYSGPTNGEDSPVGSAVDRWGNVYVTGSSTGRGTSTDYATIKYAPDGTELWVARYDGPAGREDEPTALALDYDGNAYVAGGSWGVNSQEDFAVVKYDSQGNLQWAQRYNGPGNGRDLATALTLDQDGQALVTGCSYKTTR